MWRKKECRVLIGPREESRQLWAVQPGEELGMGETAIAKRRYKSVVRESLGWDK